MSTDPNVTLRGLQAAVALMTARIWDVEVDQGEVLGDTPAEEALSALAVIAAASMGATMPDLGKPVLRNIGGLAAQAETGAA
ncbi:hypothetical protein [Streptomyces lavendulae]|uniref:hypothetical protein n=1 Tax=Streptomyces lavendulae TaxID=1914 RepID=UPI0024A07AAE|nr:hypothetical protein Sros01_14880 [Streptomyces roseochromogenus]